MLLILQSSLIILTVGLCGCDQQKSNNDANRFIGSWQYSEDESIKNLWTFNTNGTVAISVYYVNAEIYDPPLWVTYELKDNQLCMPTGCYDYEFFNNDNNFNLMANSGKITTFERL